jgi:signal transduction histidine kinase/ActR/RegA family two-component response regulator
MLRKTVPLTLQFLLTLVGLAAGSAAVLGVLAYRSSIDGLEAGARRSAAIAAEGHNETLLQLLRLQQMRAQGFLQSVESTCGEAGRNGGIGWELGCVQTVLGEFRTTEHATNAVLTYRARRLAQSGTSAPAAPPAAGAIVRMLHREDGGADYAIEVRRTDLALGLRFAAEDLNTIFLGRYGLGDRGEVLFTDADGRLITPSRYPAAAPVGAMLREGEPQQACSNGASGDVIANDYRGVKTIHAFRPVPAIGGGCVDAHLEYGEALAPALRLRNQLLVRSGVFLAIAIILSLAASHWIAAPIRQLAASARTMQAGTFEPPASIGGPTEVQELGRAFASMSAAISDLLSKEQAARLGAEAANQAKDDFLATLSHELRTPLNAILGWIHMLRAGMLDGATTTRALAAIERNADAQTRLVEDLLDVSRIVAGNLRLNVDDVWPAAAVDAAVEALGPQIEAKRIDVRVTIDRSAGPVSADLQRLQQIAWNLLSNAVKFTPPEGRIEVRLRRANENVELAVSDTGAGMSPEFLPRAFDRFRQGDSTITRAQGGLGLGLAIVQHLAELHGGTVSAESAGPGQGATFVVTLPIVDSVRAVQAMRLTRPERAEGTLQRLDDVRVLIVDDDVDTRDVVGAILAGAGANVATAASASEARDAVHQWRPTVIVADIAMPAEDGYSLIRSLRTGGAVYRGVPAIALTALATPADADAALAAGFQIHLTKPVDGRKLVHTIATLAIEGDRAEPL